MDGGSGADGGTLVYVHGGGRQDADRLHRELDEALGGRYAGRSRLAFYADICWPDSPAIVDLIDLVARAAEPGEESAERLVAGFAADGMSIDPDDEHDLVEFGASIFDRIGLADPDTFVTARRGAGNFFRDLTAYLCDRDRTVANRMRVRVREAVEASPAPHVIVAHSLGSMIAYDIVAADPSLAAWEVVTVGSPLGVGFVQGRLRDRAGRPNPVPSGIRWANAFDRLDVKVGFHPKLASAFARPNPIVDQPPVGNRGWDRHDFAGYLETPVVAAAIAATSVGPSG